MRVSSQNPVVPSISPHNILKGNGQSGGDLLERVAESIIVHESKFTIDFTRDLDVWCREACNLASDEEGLERVNTEGIVVDADDRFA